MSQVADLVRVKFDADGYLDNANDWSPELASVLSKEEGITLTDRHWVVINFVRDEFAKNGDAPTMRRITKATDVSTKELYKLFPKGPAKKAARIAGLKKPTGCI